MKKLACPCEYQDSRQILQRFARICYKTIKFEKIVRGKEKETISGHHPSTVSNSKRGENEKACSCEYKNNRDILQKCASKYYKSIKFKKFCGLPGLRAAPAPGKEFLEQFGAFPFQYPAV